MFCIIKTLNKEYIVKIKNHSMFLPNIDTLIITLLDLGMESSEIEYGLTELVRNDHNYIDVGINKNVIFTRKLA